MCHTITMNSTDNQQPNIRQPNVNSDSTPPATQTPPETPSDALQTTSQDYSIDNLTPNEKRLAQMFSKAKGNITKTCEAAGLARQTFYRLRDTNPEFAAIIHDIEEEQLDALEQRLFDLAANPTHQDSFKALTKALNAKGKSRGYGNTCSTNDPSSTAANQPTPRHLQQQQEEKQIEDKITLLMDKHFQDMKKTKETT